MTRNCQVFRRRLAARLMGPPPPDLGELAWHHHLLSCEECRNLLAEEEALEELLRTLPDPRLPPHLAQRVLERLRRTRPSDVALDELLDRAGPVAAPDGLAARVLDGLEEPRSLAAREAALDALLGGVPDPVVPEDLADNLVRALADEHDRAAARTSGGTVRWIRLRRPLAAAAAVLLSLATIWTLWPEPAAEPGTEVAGGVEAPPDELLDSFELLEWWDVLQSQELDHLLASLDIAEEVVLEVNAEGI